MQKYIIPRHFVDSEGKLGELKKGIEELLTAHDISEAKNYGLKFGINITIDGENNPELIDETEIALLNFRRSGIPVFQYNKNRGAGTSYRQVLFNPSRLGINIVVCSDLDQFVLGEENALQNLHEITCMSEKDNVLYTAGERNVPVVLATNERNSHLREIHELFHSLAGGFQKIKTHERSSGVPKHSFVAKKDEQSSVVDCQNPAYAEFGDSVSGLYVMNMGHPAYPILKSAMVSASKNADMSGFASDYYTAVKAPRLGKVAGRMVAAKQNQFYSKRSESEEFESVKRLVTTQTRELAKTDIKNHLLNVLKNPENCTKLSEFYDREDVGLIMELMIESLC